MGDIAALANLACPICGRIADKVILIEKRITKKGISDLNNQTVGYADKPCDDCNKHYKDDCPIVVIDPSKSEFGSNGLMKNNFHRTGHIAFIKRDSDFYNDVKNNNQIANFHNVEIIFMDEESAIHLGFIKQEN